MEAEALLRLYETLLHYGAWALGVLAGLCSLFTGVLLAEDQGLPCEGNLCKGYQ